MNLRYWRQEGRRLWMDCEVGSFHWDMPKKWKLKKTHPDLIKLAEWVLLDPWTPGIIDKHEWSRKPGKKPGLSFSAGIESTAAMLIMPRNTVIAYHERDFESMLKHDNAKRFIKRLRWRYFRKITIVKSNHEKIRTHFGKANGFSTDLACAVHLILMADFLDLDSISVGMPIDNSWLSKGQKFRDFPNTHWYNKWPPIFKKAGLEIILPVNMISQAGCLEVVQKRGFADWAQSCLRASAGDTCGRCWKCFFKNSLLDHPVDTSSNEIQKFSSTEPLKTAAMVLYASKKTGLFNNLPQLKRFEHINLDWFNQIYPPGFELIPEKYREGIRQNILGVLSEMQEPYALEYTDLENPPYRCPTNEELRLENTAKQEAEVATKAGREAEENIQREKKIRLQRFHDSQLLANSEYPPVEINDSDISAQDKEIYERLVPHFCSKDRHNFEYKILSELHDFLTSRNIDYWAIGGTLLGQMKYSGTIPWDHDIDIFTEQLSENTEDELIQLISKIEGCAIRRWLWSNRIPGMQIHDMRNGPAIAIDIFYGEFHDDTIYTKNLINNIEKFPSKGRQGVDRIINPGSRMVNFGNTKISVPNVESTIEYLDWKFGENWEDEYVIFDFKEKTSISFPANDRIDEKLRSFVVNRSLK